MKYTKRPTELGEEWLQDESGWAFWAVVIALTLGLIVLTTEFFGIADKIINYFA